MSLQNATEFAKAALTNPALLSEIAAATAEKSAEAAGQAVSDIGKREGFEFTSAEALEVRNAHVGENDELSEDSLAAVAGGITTTQATYVQGQVTYISGGLAGEAVPGGGGIIGAGIGAGVGTAMNGGSASDSLASGAMGAAQAQNDLGAQIRSFFSGW